MRRVLDSCNPPKAERSGHRVLAVSLRLLNSCNFPISNYRYIFTFRYSNPVVSYSPQITSFSDCEAKSVPRKRGVSNRLRVLLYGVYVDFSGFWFSWLASESQAFGTYYPTLGRRSCHSGAENTSEVGDTTRIRYWVADI